MEQALAECDLFIGNCGPGTAFDALLAGKPCLLCPAHLEQAMLGIRLQAQGFARIFWRQEPEQAIAEIQNFFDSPLAFTKATEFSQKYQPFSIADQLERLSKILTDD
jgi:UDP:flavonoid glycosyltransferase YjiC (YdhE family)